MRTKSVESGGRNNSYVANIVQNCHLQTVYMQTANT